jgi:hypothetical protein
MPQLATVSGSHLPRLELSGNGAEACMSGRLNVPNDREHVGSELRCLRPTSHRHALHGAGGSGRPQPLSPRLSGCQSRLGTFRDRFALVLGNGGKQPEGNRRLHAAHRRYSRSFVGPAG